MKPTLTTATLTAVTLIAASGAATTSASASHPVSKAAYSAELQQIGTTLMTTLNRLGENNHAFARIEKNVARGRSALEQAATRLDRTTPPLDARADNTTIALGLRYFATALAQLKTDAARHDVHAISVFEPTLERSPAIKPMLRAIIDLQKKGYKVGQLAPDTRSH
jgi:hypothetical protein